MDLQILHQDAGAVRAADAALDPLDRDVAQSEDRTGELHKSTQPFWNPYHWAEARERWAQSLERTQIARQARRDGKKRLVKYLRGLWSDLNETIGQATQELPQVRDTLAALQVDFPSLPGFPENDSTERMRLAVGANVWRKFERVVEAINAVEVKA